MNILLNRRRFLKSAGQAGLSLAGLGLLGVSRARAIEPLKRTGPARFRVSLVAYSFREFFTAKDPAKKIDLVRFIDFASEQGCDGVEITQYYFPAEVTDDYLAKLRRHAFLRGVVVSGTGAGCRFAVPKGEKLDAAIRDAKKRIDYAAAIGAPFLRVFSGGTPKDLETELFKNCVASLEECANYAGQKGVFLGLENDQQMTTTVEGTLQILKAVNSPWLASNLDTGNFHESDDVYGDLEKLAPYAINVHFKTQTHPRGKDPQPMDVPRVLKMLRAVNYQGYLALEYEAKEDPWQAVPEWLTKLKIARSA